MITRLLVANRGEIARRVFATCRRLGIETVAVHSDADADLPHVREADFTVRLPGSSPAETYLRGDLVIDAARRAGADAVHPGYGFLSESAGFAQAVIDAGLTWIGPPPAAIEAMGSKIGAKELMAAAGVPVLGAPSPPAEADLPLLVKASAGGGGRGMRIVRSLADLPAEIEKASAEAASAFGDGTVFVEPYVENSRHVEVQIWGDHGGSTISVLGARDCSLQRRHQKVVEEAPPPGFTDAQLKPLYDAARKAGEALHDLGGYVGVGTVEFLVDAEDLDRFWFLEMNTRLQVEHPVTELVTGLDLVELQLVAATDPTTLAVSAAEPDGFAIEVRLYAEDPAADYAPQSGLLSLFEVPGVDVELGPLPVSSSRSGLRLDAGYVTGSEVSTHYDAMIAKLVATGPTRREAARRLVTALRRARIHGVTTNRDQLVAVLESPEFLAGWVSTAFLAGATLGPESPGDSGRSERLALVAGALMLAADDASRRTVQRGIPAAWRNVVSQPQRTEFEGHEPVEWWGTRDGFVVDGMTVLEVSPTHVRLEVDGVATETRGHKSSTVPGAPREIWVDGPVGSACLREVPRFTDPADQVASGSLLAHMPGTVVSVAAVAGQRVEAGDPVLVLEAMKMQHTVTAPTAGTVTTIHVAAGQQVAAGDVLAVVEQEEQE